MFYDTRDDVLVTSVLLTGTTERINKYNFIYVRMQAQQVQLWEHF